MVLTSEIVGHLSHNYRQKGLGDKIYRNPSHTDYMEIFDFGFRFNVNKRDLEIIVYYPDETGDACKMSLERIKCRNKSDFMKIDEISVGEKNSYVLKCHFASNNRRKTFSNIRNGIISQILSYPRTKDRSK